MWPSNQWHYCFGEKFCENLAVFVSGDRGVALFGLLLDRMKARSCIWFSCEKLGECEKARDMCQSTSSGLGFCMECARMSYSETTKIFGFLDGLFGICARAICITMVFGSNNAV